MIRIHRGREPATLPPIRRSELTRVRTLAKAGSLNSRTIGSKYTVVRDDLCSAQHSKCSYCERNNLEPAFLPVEHFRPKLQAMRADGTSDDGYWWLAWTWRNLLFSCQPCNTSFKGVQFPLDSGSGVLIPEQRPPGAERPLLIDPAGEDPIAHIKFTFHPGLPKHRWRPLPRSGSRRGGETIRDLGLDRPALLDLYERHVDDHVTPIVNRLTAAIRARNKSLVTTTWTNEVASLLNPNRPFTALSYDAFDYFVSYSIRRTWGFSLPRPK